MAEASDVVTSLGSHRLRYGEVALAAALFALVALAARAQTFGNPLLGFDEQFYLLVGDRMLHGALPFVDIFDRKPIGLFLIFAAIRLIGGEGTLQYQLVASGFAIATALLIWRLARGLTEKTGALAAGIAYLLWLNFLGGEGGQAPVFYNLLVVAAAMLTSRAIERGRATVESGAAPLLLVGLAMQVKYTALFEGVLFGCALLWAVWRDRRESLRIAGFAAAWIATAILPTLIALLFYAARGEAHAFVFANFTSLFGKLPDPLTTSAVGLLKILAILSPLLACAAFPPPAADGCIANWREFLRLW
ncbi:MAG: glycosyltransferase family 39 protein, partial [Pseudomonadota bacterium]|nr:glycosyltransferase family 39 protein [Pseudomonadota bacterium]